MIHIKEVKKIYSIYHPHTKEMVDMALCLFVDEEDREHEQVVKVDALPTFYEDEEMTIPKELHARIEMIAIDDSIRTIILPLNK